MIGMMADRNRQESTSSLINVLEDELNWLLSKQYTSQTPYLQLLEAIHNIPQHSSDDLNQLARQLYVKFQDLSLHVGQKFKALIDISISEVNHLQEHTKQLGYELNGLRDHNQTLNETIDSLNEKMAWWENEYDTLKLEASEMQQRYEKELKHIRREKKEIRRTFLQVQEDTEQERMLLEDLHIERLEISQKIIEEKRANEALKQELEQLKRHLSESQKKASTSATKIEYEERQIEKLEEELLQKNRLIEQLYQAQRPSEESIMSNMFDEEPNQFRFLDYPPASSLIRQVSIVEKFKLGEEVRLSKELDFKSLKQRSIKNSTHSQYSHEEAHQDVHNSIQINRSIIEEEIESSGVDPSVKVKSFPTPDIYFSHYILTVQGVKLKMDRQDVLEIDLGNMNFYQKMIEERVPFHQWDSWIQKTLASMIP